MIQNLKKLALMFCYLLICLGSSQASSAGLKQSDDMQLTGFSPAAYGQHRATFIVADAEVFSVDDTEPQSGTILLPDDYYEEVDNEGNKEKKCMTVCKRWGEDCILDPVRGRKCRRTCKEFGQECF